MNDIKIRASSRDKAIGGVLLTIGILWILAILYTTYQDYTSVFNTRTLGQAAMGALLNSLIPLLLVTSGQYYLSGKNAQRLAKKGKLPTTQANQNVASNVNTTPNTSVGQAPQTPTSDPNADTGSDSKQQNKF